MANAHESEALRVLILWYRDNRPHRCFYCGRHLLTRPRRSQSWPTGRPKPNQRTIDHVTPECCGGSNLNDNKVACCFPCNNRKGCLTLELFRQLFGPLVDGKFFGELEYLARKN